MIKKVKRNYINNADFLIALIEYKKLCEETKRVHEENRLNYEYVKPEVPRYIGEAFLKIAHGVSIRPNFSGYSYIEDMKMDGIENCLQYLHNFDSDKYSNPFAYFTQIIWFAFLRRIAKEKKQLYIKFASSQQMVSNGETYDGEDLSMYLNNNVEYMNSFIQEYEDKNFKKKEEENATNTDKGSD